MILVNFICFLKCSYNVIKIPEFLEIDGWDISNFNIGDAMRRAKVLDINLQDQVYEKLSKSVPRPSIYDPDFIAANQVFFSITKIKKNRNNY